LATNKFKEITLSSLNIHWKKGWGIVLLGYIDDIIMIGNDEKENEELKQRLVQEFELKELGRLKYFSGIEVAYSNLELSYLSKNI